MIRGSMKAGLLCVLAVCLVFGLCGCGASDWIYTQLPGNYAVLFVNSEDIILCTVSAEGQPLEPVVERYVQAFCCDERYIGIRQLVVDPEIPYEEVRISNLDPANRAYYLVDTQEKDLEKAVYGPFSAAEYQSKVEELKLENMDQWIETKKAPTGSWKP